MDEDFRRALTSKVRSHTCFEPYSTEEMCLKPLGHEGEHGIREFSGWPKMTDTRADHPFEITLREWTCSMCSNQAAHKAEETSGDAGRHPLSTWLCCEHFKTVFGACA